MPNNKKKPAKKTGLHPSGRKYTLAEQRKRDKASRARAARERNDIRLRATGRKELASNYGKFKGEGKKKKK